MRSLWLILPAASALLGDDVVTAGSIPSRARFGVRTPWRARLIGSPKPGLEVIAKVRLAQCLQSDLGLQISPHPLSAEGLDLPHQHRRSARMDTALVDRPRPATPNQHPHPTTACPTPTTPPTPPTNTRRRVREDGAEHRHTINTAATPAPTPKSNINKGDTDSYTRAEIVSIFD